jgi:hypothetical protein
MFLKTLTKTKNYIRNALKKMGLFGKFDFGSILTPCILEKVTARQNHLHITFTDFDKEYSKSYTRGAGTGSFHFNPGFKW